MLVTRPLSARPAEIRRSTGRSRRSPGRVRSPEVGQFVANRLLKATTHFVRVVAKTRQGLVDSGCGQDLADAKKVSHLHNLVRPAEYQPTLRAANGITHVRNEFPLWIEPLKEVCNPYVMTGSPDIDQGYEFHWLAHDSKPFFIGGDSHA